MQTLLRLLAGLSLSAFAASAHAELSPVSFTLGKQQFRPGDAIVIDQVLATSPRFEIGTRILVRGHYQLASADKAQLGLRVTHRGAAGIDALAPSQSISIQKQNGSFELSCDITYAGDPHVSFYPDPEGESFGGVYFSTASEKAKIGRGYLPAGGPVVAR